MNKLTNIKAVMCDVDGTLLNQDGIVSPATVEAIKKIREKGILFGLSTGRDVHSVKTLLTVWGISGLVDVPVSDFPLIYGLFSLKYNFGKTLPMLSIIGYFNREMSIYVRSVEKQNVNVSPQASFRYLWSNAVHHLSIRPAKMKNHTHPWPFRHHIHPDVKWKMLDYCVQNVEEKQSFHE